MISKVGGMIRDCRCVASETVLTMDDYCNVVKAVQNDRSAPQPGQSVIFA